MPQKRRKNAVDKAKSGEAESIEKTIWEINAQKIPVEIHREKRNSWRYTFAKGGKLVVRLPKTDKLTEARLVGDMQAKLTSRLTKKPELNQFFATKTYQDGDLLTVNKRSYTVQIIVEDRKTHTGKQMAKGIIECRLAAADTEGGRQKAISTLLSRIVANDFAPEFSRRVAELNFLYFRQTIKGIHFKYNHSNWGSCSSSGNLNFSSRLLFAPDAVQDYVIIHELAHLIELNHSDRFWHLVAEAMPDYREKEKWLKENSAYCRF